jgi:cobalt/nickel transport system permease protein
MDLDRHVPRDSPIHRFDARLKLLLALAMILAIAALPMGAFVALGIALAVLTVASWWAQLGATRLVRNAWVVLPFALVALPLMFTRPGEVIASFEIGPLALSVSQEGLRDALTIVLKSWVSVQVALLLAFTTPFVEVLGALRGLHVPAVIVSIIASMYRFLAVIGDEAARMRRARKSRSAVGADGGGGGLVWRGRVTGALVGSLFIRAYERSERVHVAMSSRGYDGRPLATSAPRPDQRSLLAFGIMLAAVVLYVVVAVVISS